MSNSVSFVFNFLAFFPSVVSLTCYLAFDAVHICFIGNPVLLLTFFFLFALFKTTMSLSTLRARVPLVSLASLTDDSLLVILRLLSVPQLLAFLSLSRRFNCLIVQYIFSRYRTLAMPMLYHYWMYMDIEQPVFFSRNFHAYTTFYRNRGSFFRYNYLLKNEENHHRQLYLSRPSSFLLHLPNLFSRLESFAVSYKFGDESHPLSEEETIISRLCVGFLRSTWSRTLVSLQVQVIMSALPQSNETIFSQLNQLSALRHLFLRFRFPGDTEMLIDFLPDSMPVLGQLVSFSLHVYKGVNIGTILGQLAPDLAYLSLVSVPCSEPDFCAFLTSKPSYKHTLRTLELGLCDDTFKVWCSPQASTLVRHCLSLENLSLVNLSNLFSVDVSCYRTVSRFSPTDQ